MKAPLARRMAKPAPAKRPSAHQNQAVDAALVAKKRLAQQVAAGKQQKRKQPGAMPPPPPRAARGSGGGARPAATHNRKSIFTTMSARTLDTADIDSGDARKVSEELFICAHVGSKMPPGMSSIASVAHGCALCLMTVYHDFFPLFVRSLWGCPLFKSMQYLEQHWTMSPSSL